MVEPNNFHNILSKGVMNQNMPIQYLSSDSNDSSDNDDDDATDFVEDLNKKPMHGGAVHFDAKANLQDGREAMAKIKNAKISLAVVHNNKKFEDVYLKAEKVG